MNLDASLALVQGLPLQQHCASMVGDMVAQAIPQRASLHAADPCVRNSSQVTGKAALGTQKLALTPLGLPRLFISLASPRGSKRTFPIRGLRKLEPDKRIPPA